MKMQLMCAPWRRASCSYTKASLKTLSQYWWGFFFISCVFHWFFFPFHNSSSSQGFFCFVWRKRLSNWRALPIISPLMYSFWKRFFLTNWKGQCCVCVCVCSSEIAHRRLCWWMFCLFFSAWRKSVRLLFVLLHSLPKTRSYRATWRK